MAHALVVEPGELGELLATLLQQYGISAERARTGEEALERALASAPEIVIVDQMLADVPGVEVAELLRSELGAKAVLMYPQQLIAEPDDALLARIRAMDGSFLRPFRSLSLVELVAKLLEIELPSAAGRAAGSALSSTEGAAVSDEDEPAELLLDIAVEEAAVEEATVGEGARDDAATDDGARGDHAQTHVARPLDRSRGADDARPFSPGALTELWQRVKARRQSPAAQPLASGEGALSPRSLADALDAFHQSQTTGELWLQSGNARRVLFLRRGVIAGARSNIEGEDLLGLALKHALIEASDVLAVREDLKKGARKNVLDALLARGLLAEAGLQRLVQEHTRLVALKSFAWHAGTLRVTFEGRATREPVAARVPVADVIVRGILLTETDDALLHAAPDDARFTPASDAGHGLNDLALSSGEARIVIAMDGTKTIADLAILFPEVPPRVIRGLAAGLYCVGLVRFAGWGAAAARRISYF